MKKIITMLLSILFLLNCQIMVLAEGGNAWSKASDWAVTELTKAKEKKLIPESLNGEDLTKKVNREEFAEISVRVYEALTEKTAAAAEVNPFTDTNNPEILKAYNLGITTGISENTFAPENNLTREQAAVMLARAYTKAFSLEKLPEISDKKLFEDDSNISDWAKESVYYMASKGIISGVSDNRFAPKYLNDEEKEAGYGCATREQALLIAVRICETFKAEKTNETENKIKPKLEEIVSTKKENEYVIAFIGGSLTAGGSEWINSVVEFYKTKYPEKDVKAINAGIGGTGSKMGAERYRKDVLVHEPDLVFIEFAVNDREEDENGAKVYMENMIRQSLEMKNVPDIIFLYTPIAADLESEKHQEWLNGVNWKEEVAEHYGISSINIHDYLYEEYKESGETQSFFDYLAKYYVRSGEGYNVHGGYEKYSEAILKALNEDFEKYMVKPENVDIMTTQEAECRYQYISASSSEIRYSKNQWELFTAAPVGAKAYHDISEQYFGGIYFPEGIQQTETNGAMFGYKTTPGINAIKLSYISSNKGADATVKIDGKEVAKISCMSPYHGMNYTTEWVEVPNDGKEHDVIITVDGIDEEKTVFRFGAIIERF